METTRNDVCAIREQNSTKPELRNSNKPQIPQRGGAATTKGRCRRIGVWANAETVGEAFPLCAGLKKKQSGTLRLQSLRFADTP